jgi:ribosome biogenesis GTPase
MSWLTDSHDDDEDKYADYEARTRPNPKGNRARTKIRPEHSDAVTGRVLTVDRGRYSVLVSEGTDAEHEATASRASELRKQAIVTGDRVDLVGDTSGDDGSLSRIVRIQPRVTVLRRSADDTDEVERIIVANADQMLIVVAAADPEPRSRLVDRYLVAAFDAGIAPILCITKTDLADPTEFLSNFAGLDIRVVTSGEGAMPTDEIAGLLSGHTTVAESPHS